jgi:N-acetylneuraminic acid mutarotase
MLNGDPATAIAFTVPLAGVGDSYSFVAANFRTGNPPPAGRDEMLLAIDSPATGGVTLTQVHARLFHVDFVTPGNSTFGIGTDHTPNAEISVNGFIDAFTSANGFTIVPQSGTGQRIDTLGDKIMTPMVYRFDGATESLWTSNTVCTDAPCTQPTGIRWYQFDVTGGTFPATPVQQQTWTNNDDGLYRFMSSIAVDNAGDTVIGYSTSSSTAFPGIRYAGRLANDPPSDLVQGEATMFSGTGSESDTNGRWGDYSMTTVDTDGMTFWHVNEYEATTGSFNWHTRIGKFNFVGGGTPTPTPTGTPSATPTATPSECTWSAGPDLPSGPGTRIVGVFFPGNGNFYGMGGRASDVAGSDFTNPFEFNPVGNSWTVKSATYPDNNVNNMACGVLNESGTDYIYCVGGSAAGQTTAIARVFRYNPVSDTIETLTAPDDWPGDAVGTILPGGFSVANNKLYILGGFNINVASTNEIWEFDPTAAVGSKWTQKVNTPMGVMYAPTCTINGTIYLAGASDFDTVNLLVIDTTNSFSFDPAANTIGSIAAIPRATGETRALNFNGQMYVMGGGRVAPNPSNEVDIYDPGTNTWSTGIPFVTGRRNFPTDTNGTDTIWLAGGYDSTGVPVASMEIFNCPQASPTPTPTPTPTATATATATPSITPSATPTATVRPPPTPRPRPTPHPRP